MIKELRKENADRRTKAKELEDKVKKSSDEVGSFKSSLLKALGGSEDENTKPEDKVAELIKKNEQLEYERGLTQLAFTHNIESKDLKYFEFLVLQASQALKDGAELPEQALKDIVDQVKSVSGSKEKATSTVGGDPQGKVDPQAEGTSLDDFKKMNIVEKQKLYDKAPETYEKLKKELLKSGGSLI